MHVINRMLCALWNAIIIAHQSRQNAKLLLTCLKTSLGSGDSVGMCYYAQLAYNCSVTQVQLFQLLVLTQSTSDVRRAAKLAQGGDLWHKLSGWLYQMDARGFKQRDMLSLYKLTTCNFSSVMSSVYLYI